MVYIKFPKHIRLWITEERGNLSPAQFLYNIIEQHYRRTLSYKEKTIGSTGHCTGAEPVLQSVLPAIHSE